MKLSVVIPVYNEEKTILQVVTRVQAVGLDTEIVIVNDCSTDGTRERLDAIQGAANIKIIHHERNQGKGAALRTAQKHVTGDVVVIQDADLEYSPDEFPRMFKYFETDQADAVFGSRYAGTEVLVDSFWHYFGNKVLTVLSNIMSNLHLTDMETCYKMVRASFFKEMTIKCSCFGFEPEITAKLARTKCRIYEVPISYCARRFDEGKKIGCWDGVKAIYYILRFNLLP